MRVFREAAHDGRLEGPDQRPYLDESYRIHEGLASRASCCVEINRLGLPAGSEFLDPISPQYIGDLIAGARSARARPRARCTASWRRLSRRRSASRTAPTATSASPSTPSRPQPPHHFLSVHKNGQVAIVETRGNRDCHVILRGGKAPNYDAATWPPCSEIEAAKLPCRLMIDASHANSEQAAPAPGRRRARRRGAAGRRQPLHLRRDGREPPRGGRAEVCRRQRTTRRQLTFGQSITDPCIGGTTSIEGVARSATRCWRGGAVHDGLTWPAGASLALARQLRSLRQLDFVAAQSVEVGAAWARARQDEVSKRRPLAEARLTGRRGAHRLEPAPGAARSPFSWRPARCLIDARPVGDRASLRVPAGRMFSRGRTSRCSVRAPSSKRSTALRSLSSSKPGTDSSPPRLNSSCWMTRAVRAPRWQRRCRRAARPGGIELVDVAHRPARAGGFWRPGCRPEPVVPSSPAQGGDLRHGG